MKKKAGNYNGKTGTLQYAKNKNVAVMSVHHLVCYLQVWSANESGVGLESCMVVWIRTLFSWDMIPCHCTLGF